METETTSAIRVGDEHAGADAIQFATSRASHEKKCFQRVLQGERLRQHSHGLGRGLSLQIQEQIVLEESDSRQPRSPLELAQRN